MTTAEPIAVTRWWWVRHAPVINPRNCLYGQQDLPADTTRGADFSALAHRLPVAAIWLVTPLQRTRQTADAILAADPAGRLAPCSRTVEGALMEQSFGDWQGRTQAEIVADDPAGAARFWADPARARPPGGESFEGLIGRVAPAVDRLSAKHADADIVAVSHGGTIRAALVQALSLEPQAALRLVIDTVSLTRIDRIQAPDAAPEWRVECVNFRPYS